MPTYPILPADFELRIRAVEVAAAGDPNYLDTPECPYGEGLKKQLRKVLAPPPVPSEKRGPSGEQVEEYLRRKTATVFDVPEADKYDVLLREVEATIDEMRSIEHSVAMSDGDDTGARIALVKAKTTLLEKWASLKERVFTLKEMSQFQQAVIGAMDEVLDVDQRSEFRARLRDFKSVEKVPEVERAVVGNGIDVHDDNGEAL